MTVYGLVASLVWCAVFLAVYQTLPDWLSRWLTLQERLADAEIGAAIAARDLAIVQREESLRAARLARPRAAEIPEDLNALVDEESEKWLRDEMRQGMQDRYIEHGDWNAVRRAYGIGIIPTAD